MRVEYVSQREEVIAQPGYNDPNGYVISLQLFFFISVGRCAFYYIDGSISWSECTVHQ